MRLKWPALALAALMATPAQAQTAPDTLPLAHRLVEDQAGGSDYMTSVGQSALAGYDRLTRNSQDPTVPARRAAMQQALAESRSDIVLLEDQLAGVYAANLDAAELSGWIAFLESPDGKSIQAKKIQAGWPLGQPDLTPAETAAQHAFDTSPVGQSITAKNNTILGQSLKFMLAFQVKLGARANAIYCATAKTCPSAPPAT